MFAADAVAAYQDIGEFRGPAAIIGLIDSVIARCATTQHLLSNVQVDIRGQRATASSYLQAIYVGTGVHAGELQTLWGEYRDELEKRPEGWRIVRRELRTLHNQGDVGLLA
ncbi:hypothetical protein D3C84_831740 [compost metagenome]